MHNRALIVLALAGLVVACAPGVTGPPITYDSTPSRVAPLTQAFSFESNGGLRKIADSLGGLSGATGALGTIGQNARYGVLGEVREGDTRFVYDDVTRELTAIEHPNAALALAFLNQGARRRLDVTITRAADGTTGALSLEAEGTWKPRTPATGRAFKIANDETLSTLDRLKLGFDLAPKGDANAALRLDAELADSREWTFLGLGRFPTRWTFSARIPDLNADWQSTIVPEKGKTKFDASGTITARLDAGVERFRYTIALDEATRSAEAQLINEGGKVRLVVTATQPDASRPAQFTAVIKPTDGDTILATVSADPAAPGTALVRYSDGRVDRWVVLPKDFKAPSLPRL